MAAQPVWKMLVSKAATRVGAGMANSASRCAFCSLKRWASSLERQTSTIVAPSPSARPTIRLRQPSGSPACLGCPLNNLAQEMNPLDAGFRDRTTRVFHTWREAYRSALLRAQHHGIVSAALEPDDAAHMLVAQIEGTLSLARSTQDPQTLTAGARALRSYLAAIRAPGH